MNSPKDFLKRYALVLFFPLAYLLSWWSVLVPQAGGGIMPQGPLAAALILVALTEGRAGLKTWWRRITNGRVPWIWFLVAPAFMLALHLGGGLINLLMGASVNPLDFSRLLPSIIMIVFLGGQWEEPGWTAYALPEMQKRFPGRPMLATGILGILRAAWHLPLMFSGAVPWYDVLFLSFAFQFVIAWLYNRSGSALIVILFHFSSNFIFLFVGQIFSGADAARHYVLYVLVACILAGALIYKSRPSLGLQAQAAD